MGPKIRRIFARSRLGRLIAVLLLWTTVIAPAAADPRLHGQGRLWQVTRGDAAPSHVFGTMHVTDADVVDVPAEIRRAIVRSNRLVLELESSKELEARMAQAMIFTDGRRLQDVIGEKLFAKLEAIAARYGLAPQQLSLFRPWALIMILGMPPQELARQAQGQQVLDRILEQYAKDNGMPVFGLETPEDQIKAIADLTRKDQVALLESSVTENHRVEEIFDAFKKAYLRGDLDDLHAMSDKLMASASPDVAATFQQSFIDGRNRHMADRAVEHLDAGGAFIAVGALHLSGKKGLLHLLEKKGYTVKRVN